MLSAVLRRFGVELAMVVPGIPNDQRPYGQPDLRLLHPGALGHVPEGFCACGRYRRRQGLVVDYDGERIRHELRRLPCIGSSGHEYDLHDRGGDSRLCQGRLERNELRDQDLLGLAAGFAVRVATWRQDHNRDDDDGNHLGQLVTPLGLVVKGAQMEQAEGAPSGPA